MPTANVADSSISYTERGRGQSLVMLHGFPLDSRIWGKQVDALSDAFRVIAVDLGGFGKSASNEPFTIAQQAEIVHKMLVQIRALPCVLAGLSMGGYVSLSLARQFPAALSGLILVDTKADSDTAEGKVARNKMIESVRSGGSKVIADQMMPRMLAADTIQHRPQVVRELRAIMENCPALTIEHALSAMREREDQTSLLPSIAVPTLIIVGQDDVITPPRVAEVMHRAIPHSQLEIIHGAGHMTPMEQPEQVSQSIRRFLGLISSST